MSQDDLSLLLEQLQEGDPKARLQAVSVLLDRRDPASVDGLVVALQDPNHQVRSWAASALGWIGDDSVAEAIVPLLMESPQEGWDARINPPMCACFALALLRRVEPIMPLLEHEDEHVRSLAVITLRYIGDERTFERLTEVSEIDPTALVRDEALDALEAMRSPDYISLWQQMTE